MMVAKKPGPTGVTKQEMGGHARAARLSDTRRSAIARSAATARWARERAEKPVYRLTHEVAKEMLEKCAQDGRPRMLFVIGQRVFYCEVGTSECESWLRSNRDNCAGTFTHTNSLTEVIEEVCEL